VDIFVFGAQEMALDSKTFGAMLRSLVGSENYTVLTHKRMSGIYIGILIKRSLKHSINKKEIKVKATRTGIGNLYGNKGAVGVSFRINRTSFCFINAHLAANRSNKCLQERIEDLVLIVQGLDLGNKQIDFTHQFHAMFLFGDLNFRVRGNLTSDKVVNLIEKGQHLTLLKNDELTTLRAPYSDNIKYQKLKKNYTDPLLQSTLLQNNIRSQTEPGIISKKYDDDDDAADLDEIGLGTTYDETMNLFKSDSSSQNVFKLDNIDESKQNDDSEPAQTMIMKEDIDQNRKLSNASNLTGDDEWDDIENEDELKSNPEIIEKEKEGITLQSIPETERSSIHSAHTVNDEEFHEMMMEKKKKLNNFKKKLNEKKKKKKKKKKEKVEEMLNLLPMLQSFVEGPILFAPTYKFEKGRDQYTSKRIPAWCDRILWVIPPHPAINIKQSIYSSSSITPPISDHRPVFSEFHITYNKSWDPPKDSQWLVSIRNFHLFLYSFNNNERNENQSKNKTHQISKSMPSRDNIKTFNQNQNKSIVPYLTVHSPLLATCMRTTMGRRVKNNDSVQSIDSDQSLLCYKFNTKQFVVRYIDHSNLGNGCLWIVIRDDNLLGDVDVIGASAIPLIDSMKLTNDEKDVYVHFKRDVTFATSKRGYIEGQMKCECMQTM